MIVGDSNDQRFFALQTSRHGVILDCDHYGRFEAIKQVAGRPFFAAKLRAELGAPLRDRAVHWAAHWVQKEER